MVAESSPPAAPLSFTDRVVGKYEILKPLATGGMAELYLARARGIEGFAKLVALKRVKSEFANDRALVEMFLDEARTMATLNHGNIVQVHDIGALEGSYFFTMEFLHGVDLRAIFKHGRKDGARIPLEHSLQIVTSTLAALHYAHEKTGPDGAPLGLVHRDVSPANVFVSYEGDVKLLDFGIAKAANQRTQTRAGTLKGKVRYMAPEQAVGATDIDRRVDIFAVSIVLWELTTGRRLFAGSSEFESLKSIVEGKVQRPSDIVDDYPPELEEIVMKGLAPAKAERFQTAREMQVALQKFAREQRLGCSPLSLSEYVSQLFHEEIEAWKAAKLEGKDLGQHVIETHDPVGSHPSISTGGRSAGRSSSREHALATTLTPDASAPSKRGAMRLWIGAAVALVAAGIMFVASRRSEPQVQPASPMPPAPASAPDAPTAAVLVPSATSKQSAPMASAPAPASASAAVTPSKPVAAPKTTAKKPPSSAPTSDAPAPIATASPATPPQPTVPRDPNDPNL